jgi:1-acyl-sn-glycerol-3-phosphate acyltransferase
VLGRIVKGARQIPVYRGTADAANALSAAVAAVQAGECVVVYPEGTVTKDPDYWPMTAKTGVARIALATGAPVIPVGQWGVQKFLGRDGRPRPFPRKRLHLRAGPPVDLSQWQGAEPTTEVLRAVTAKVMDDVTRLVGELRGEAPPETPYARRDDERRSA